jgi:catechol 2,3-dioxygenase-like lactoylglutathione lyase family enzyme
VNRLIVTLCVCALFGCASNQSSSNATKPASQAAAQPAASAKESPSMQLGNFSVSLAVKDLAASRAFYEKLGFRPFVGDNKTWLIMQNDTCTLGLHQGGLPRNSLTFNPGWDSKCNTLPEFTDVRDIQRTLRERGLSPNPAADETTEAPAFLIVTDPDGNPVIIDQHVPKAKK